MRTIAVGVLTVLIAVLFVAAAASAQAASEQAKQALQRADEFAARQDFVNASAKYEEAIHLDATLVDAYFGLAKIQDATMAEQTLRRAINVNPREGRAYGKLAEYYNRIGQFDRTVDTYRQWADVLPQDAEPRYTIGAFYWDRAYRDKKLSAGEKRDCLTKGVQAVDEALALKPEYVEALVTKGLLIRLQASFETDRTRYSELMRQAAELQHKAIEIQKRTKK